MESEAGTSSSAQPRASRGVRKCPASITSLLGGQMGKISIPLPSLRITPEDPEGAKGAVGESEETPRKSEETPRKSEQSPRISETSTVIPNNDARSISAVVQGGLRFNSEASVTHTGFVDSPRESNQTDISSRAPSDAGKPGGLRFASETSDTGLMKFLPPTYDERASSDASETRPSDGGQCKRPEGRTAGRDTVGFNFFMGSASHCPEGTTCYEDCGYGTGCHVECSEEHGIEPESTTASMTVPDFGLTGTPVAPGGGIPIYNPAGGIVRPGSYGGRPGSYTGAAPDGRYRTVPCPEACRLSNSGTVPGGQLNYYVMLLLEVFGVLIFFAICTITFWLTLAYQFIRLMVELKNADRNVQVAVAIVFGLLVLAFAICHFTNGNQSCCRGSDRSRSSCGHYKHKAKPKTATISKPFGFIKKIFSFGISSNSQKGSSCAAAQKGSSCAAAKKDHTRGRRKPRYSDCEGRAIFISSRRYAIPTEMKQPPTIVLWLLDGLGRILGQ